MTTLSFEKDIDDIEEPVAIDEDWYVFLITKPVEIKPNKAKKDGKSYEDGAGDNLVISLRLISDDEEVDGRSFTLYLPFPSAEDMESRDGRGMIKYDAKMQRIAEFAEKAKGCSAEGSDITILPNGRVGIYLVQQLAQDGQTIINSLDWFQGFKNPDDIGVPEGGGDETEDF